MFEIVGKFTTAKVMTDNVEEECVSQITRMINHIAFTNPISIMIDCHSGKGSVIGFTMPLTAKVIPNIVGVDISCGMYSFPVLAREFDKIGFSRADRLIRNRVPFGRDVYDNDSWHNMQQDFPWDRLKENLDLFIVKYESKFGPLSSSFHANREMVRDRIYAYRWFVDKCSMIGIDYHRVERSIGTLGGGNHFIEIGRPENNNDKDPYLWVTIHTGSRQFGKNAAEYWQWIAERKLRRVKENTMKDRIKEIKEIVPRKQIEAEIKKLREELGFNVASIGLDYLEDVDAQNYLFDMVFASLYADINRKKIAHTIISELELSSCFRSPMPDAMTTVHNYISFEDFIIRKGAVSSYKGSRFVVPLNMRDGVLVCEGKSNPEWNYSAPHGAGRAMSRTKAKKTFKLEEFSNTMANVFSTSVCESTLDESPMAYKNSQSIIDGIEPTATIVDVIHPIMNLKDYEDKRHFGKKKDSANEQD